MNDGKISLTSTLAWVTWALSGLVALVSLTVAALHDGTTTLGMFLCTVAILLGGAAATIHVRSFLCAYMSRVTKAYNAGRERGRLEARLAEQDAMPLQRVH